MGVSKASRNARTGPLGGERKAVNYGGETETQNRVKIKRKHGDVSRNERDQS